MEKLLKRIEEQKQGKAATANDIQDILGKDISWEDPAQPGEVGSNHGHQMKVRKITQGPAPPSYKGFSKVEEHGHGGHHNLAHTNDSGGVYGCKERQVPKRRGHKSHPPVVVRKVAAFNEEAHQKHLSSYHIPDSRRPVSNVTKPTKIRPVISERKAQEPAPTSSKTSAAAVPSSKDAIKYGSEGALTKPQVSKTAREILSEIQDEQKMISKQLLESNVALKRKVRDVQEPVMAAAKSQEQVVSRTKAYDTDSVRQYMARKKQLEKMRDKQHQEEERKRHEEKEQRLRELERKQREAAYRAVKRPLNPEVGAEEASGPNRIIGLEIDGDESERHLAPTTKHESLNPVSRSSNRYYDTGANLNTSFDSSDKENSKALSMNAKRCKPVGQLGDSKASSELKNSIQKRKFDVTDLLESSDFSLDDEVATGVQHRNRDSISTSEVNEQLSRSKALLAQLNMMRMGIPSTKQQTSGSVKKSISFQDSVDVSSALDAHADVDMDRSQDYGYSKALAHVGEGGAVDFNDRLMKLSRTADDLRCRLSSETKLLAHKIKPQSSNPSVQTLLTELMNGKHGGHPMWSNRNGPSSSYSVLHSSSNLRPRPGALHNHPSLNRPLLAPIEEASRNGTPMEKDKPVAVVEQQEDYLIPLNEIGWTGSPSKQNHKNAQNGLSNIQNGTPRHVGDAIKFSKSQGKGRSSPKSAAPEESVKPFKWMLPEPKLHVIPAENTPRASPHMADVDCQARVSTHTVMQHISKTGGPSYVMTATSDSYQRPSHNHTEDLDEYIRRILQEAELTSPVESAVVNHAHILDRVESAADGTMSAGQDVLHRGGGGDPFSVINIYTRQIAKEYSKRVEKPSNVKEKNRPLTTLEKELLSTDDEAAPNSSHPSANVSMNETANDVFRESNQSKEEQSVGESSSAQLDRMRALASPRDERLSSESSELSEIANAVLQFQAQGYEVPAVTGFDPVQPQTDRGVPSAREDIPSEELRFSPKTLERKLMSELNYLESMQESMHQLSDAEKLFAVANVQQETVALSQVLKSRQQAHDNDLRQLALKAKQETEEASRQLRDAQEKANHAAIEAGLMQRQSEAELELLARSEQLISSQQKAAEATSKVVQELADLTTKVRVVEGAESSQNVGASNPQRSDAAKGMFDGPSAQEIATTAAIAAARAVIAENLQKSMGKVSPRQQKDSSSSYQRFRSGASSGTLSPTASESSLSPRTQSRKSPVGDQELSKSSGRSPLASPGPAAVSSKRASPIPSKLTASKSQASSVSEVASIASKLSPSPQKSLVVDEDIDNFEDSRTIYTEKYTEIVSEEETVARQVEKIVPESAQNETEVSENIDENLDESLHSIGSLQAAEEVHTERSKDKSTVLSVRTENSSKKDSSYSTPHNVNSLLSKSDSVLAKSSPDESPQVSPKPLDRSRGSAKYRTSGGGDASIISTALDYSEDFDVTQEVKSKVNSAVSLSEDKPPPVPTAERASENSSRRQLPSGQQLSAAAAAEGAALDFDVTTTGLGEVEVGEGDFSEEMLKQYLREEERRAQHQAALIKLRERALKEKARAEMDYLDQLKSQSRGDGDKMSTIRKRQRAVVIKLQEEQAELRRLELANKAGSQQRQLLMVQQREIAKMRESTLHLRNKIKLLENSAGSQKVPPKASDLQRDSDFESVLKRSGTPTYLKSRKIKALKEELHEEETRLHSLRKNTASAAAVSSESGPGKSSAHGGSDSSSVLEDVDRVDYNSTSNRSASEPEDVQSSPRLPASIASSPRSLMSNGTGGKAPKFKLSPRAKSPIMPSQDVAPMSSYSDASDVEGRIQALKEDLRRRKEEAERLRQLKRGREQRSRDREHARGRLQEDSIRKQLKYYEEYIAKTSAELEREESASEEATPVAKPVIRTPSARSSTSTTPVPSANGARKSISESSSEVSPDHVQHKAEPPKDSESEKSDIDHAEDIMNLSLDRRVEQEPSHVSSKKSEAEDEVKEDLSVGEEIESESNSSSTLEDEVSISIAKDAVVESDVATPRASTPVSLSKASSKKAALSPEKDDKSSSPLLTDDEKVDDVSDLDVSHENKVSSENEQEVKEEAKEVAEGKRESIVTEIEEELLSEVSENEKSKSLDSKEEERKSKLELGDLETETNSVVKMSKEPVLSPAELASESESSKVTSSKSESEKSASETKEQIYSTVEDPIAGIDVGANVIVDGEVHGVLKFKSQVKDRFLIGVELEDSAIEHDSRCDQYFRCDSGVGMLTSIADRVKLFSKESPANETDPELVFNDDYSLDFDEKTGTGTPAATPRVVASAASIKEEILTEETSGKESEAVSDDLVNVTQPEIVEENDESSDFEPLFVHEAESIGLAVVYETIETACSFIAEPRFCTVDEKKFDFEDLEVSRKTLDIVLEPPKIEEAQIDDSELSQCCDNVFDRVFDQVLNEVFEDRKLHVGFVDSYSKELSQEFVNQAFKDSFTCRENKLGKLRSFSYSKEVSELPKVESILEETPSLEDESQRRAANALNEVKEDPLNRENELQSPSREASVESPTENWFAPAVSPTGMAGEFIDDDFAFAKSSSEEGKENREPIVPPIDISEITSEPDRTQKPTLPDSGVSVEESALSARLTSHAERIAAIVEPQMFVPCKQDEIKELSNSFSSFFFNQKQAGEDVRERKMPIELLGSDAVGSDDVSKCRKSFKVMLFELTREIVSDIYQTAPQTPPHSWMKPKMAKKVHYHGMLPTSVEMLNEIVEKKVLGLINLNLRKPNRTQTLKFGNKRRDLVDKILIQELREEESQWIDYNDDELNVKVQLTDAIFESLIDDSVNVLTKIREKHGFE